ncbi:hypothetical protein I7I48_12198 [Histoplasma ohiense]|nr:hypothetical protein I7I48_12198 [Histoplasma ohiense (nom. inval.)]
MFLSLMMSLMASDFLVGIFILMMAFLSDDVCMYVCMYVCLFVWLCFDIFEILSVIFPPKTSKYFLFCIFDDVFMFLMSIQHITLCICID